MENLAPVGWPLNAERGQPPFSWKKKRDSPHSDYNQVMRSAGRM